jgi:hypothetical protein
MLVQEMLLGFMLCLNYAVYRNLYIFICNINYIYSYSISCFNYF